MSDLSVLSLQRAGLPTFPGNSMPERLVSGRNLALAALRKYVPDLTFDVATARTTLDQISVWEERNSGALQQVLSDPSVEALPQQIQLSFGADKARQFVIAVFTEAASGLGPWTSGAVSREATTGQLLSVRWAEEDAEARLQVFGGIVKMDQDGYLQQLFVPPGATSGMGLGVAPILIWAVVVTLVAVAGLFILYLYNAKRLSENNRLMRDLCEGAQQKGDSATVSECIQATVGLQAQGPFQGFDDALQKLGQAAIWAGVAYVVLKFGVPMVLEQHEQQRRRRDFT